MRTLSPRFRKVGYLVAANLLLGALLFGQASSREGGLCTSWPNDDCRCSGTFPGDQCTTTGTTNVDCTSGPWECDYGGQQYCYTMAYTEEGEPRDEPCGVNP